MVLLAAAVAFVPRRRSLAQVAALGAALLLAMELTADHWFYLYIPWFLPFVFVALALVGERRETARSSALGGLEDVVDRHGETVGADLDDDRVDPHVSVGALEADRHLGDEALDDLVAPRAEHPVA